MYGTQEEMLIYLMSNNYFEVNKNPALKHRRKKLKNAVIILDSFRNFLVHRSHSPEKLTRTVKGRGERNLLLFIEKKKNNKNERIHQIKVPHNLSVIFFFVLPFCCLFFRVPSIN